MGNTPHWMFGSDIGDGPFEGRGLEVPSTRRDEIPKRIYSKRGTSEEIRREILQSLGWGVTEKKGTKGKEGSRGGETVRYIKQMNTYQVEDVRSSRYSCPYIYKKVVRDSCRRPCVTRQSFINNLLTT